MGILQLLSVETYDNDIALIKISPKDGRGIMAGMYIQPTCLPSDSTPYTEDLDCYISGWGETSLGRYYFFSNMKFIWISIWNIVNGQLIVSYICKTR